MRLKVLISCICFLSFIAFSAFTRDDDPFLALLKKLDEFTKKYPQEKVYLHLDKPYYAIGDNIWFKAYVTDNRTSLPTTTSNILYVELINDSDSISVQLKLPMQSGITWGDFKLPDSLREGNYRIRAYTQWMRNAGPNFFFDKTIKIGNAWSNKVYTRTSFQYNNEDSRETMKATIRFLNASATPFSNALVTYQVILGNKKTEDRATSDANGEINISVANNSSSTFKSGYILATITLPDGIKAIKKIPIKATANATDIQFFPEGGNLIEGIPCKVAIKAINANGLGENVSGTIIDNEGVEVLTFETAYLGMGTFSINPMSGKTYSAKVKLANGDEKIIALPKFEKSGYSLAVNNSDSTKMNIQVMLTADLLNSGELDLVAHRYGKVLFMGKIPTEKQIAKIIVPKTEFPSGVIQLTLFNAQHLPVCERLAFVNNIGDKIDIKFENLKPFYGKKSVVNLDAIFKNISKASQGSFSVAVTNAKMVEPDLENESNILTGFLLTANLSGYIEKPNHYFLKNDPKTIQELDQLLLTQGWRKIDWSAVSILQLPTNSFPPEAAMKISGVILNDGKPLANAKVSLMSSSKGIFATETETDANGRFIFDQIAFKDSTSFSLRAIASNGHKGVKIVLDKVPAQMITANKNSADVETNVNEIIKNYIQESVSYFNDQESRGFLNRTNQLKAVEIKAKANKAAPHSSNRNGAGVADAVFGADDIKNVISLKNFFNGRVPGVTFYQGKYYLTKNNPGIHNENDTRQRPTPPMRIYLGNVEVPNDQDMVGGFDFDDIPIDEIESVEILKSIANTNAAYGTTDGVIIISFKEGKERTVFNTRAPGMLTYSPKGFYPVRQFYSPKYDVNKDDRPDYRPTILWEPNLISDANGKANLTYYNTDQLGPVRMVIEGIDADGNLARKVFTYEVK